MGGGPFISYSRQSEPYRYRELRITALAGTTNSSDQVFAVAAEKLAVRVAFSLPPFIFTVNESDHTQFCLRKDSFHVRISDQFIFHIRDFFLSFVIYAQSYTDAALTYLVNLV